MEDPIMFVEVNIKEERPDDEAEEITERNIIYLPDIQNEFKAEMDLEPEDVMKREMKMERGVEERQEFSNNLTGDFSSGYLHVGIKTESCDVQTDTEIAGPEESSAGNKIETASTWKHSCAESCNLQEEAKRYECIVCRKNFSRSRYLQYHMSIHTGVKRYECNICQQKFSQSSNLKTHMLVHTGIKRYECTVCEKKFSISGNLRTHMLIHSGDKPYVCRVCQKSFSHTSTLRRHEFIHTGVKPHECNVCQQKFREPSTLRRHMVKHTKITS